MELVGGNTNVDYSLVLGLRNSHDKTFPASLALGSQVLVCDNLSFFGEGRADAAAYTFYRA